MSLDDVNAKMLSCDRCGYTFCAPCINKPDIEDEIIKNSDCMWFCNDCKIPVKKVIETDLDIERRCQEITLNYEQRISHLKSEMESKCSEAKVNKMIEDEITKRQLITEELVHTIVKKCIETGKSSAQHGAPFLTNL